MVSRIGWILHARKQYAWKSDPSIIHPTSCIRHMMPHIHAFVSLIISLTSHWLMHICGSLVVHLYRFELPLSRKNLSHPQARWHGSNRWQTRLDVQRLPAGALLFGPEFTKFKMWLLQIRNKCVLRVSSRSFRFGSDKTYTDWEKWIYYVMYICICISIYVYWPAGCVVVGFDQALFVVEVTQYTLCSKSIQSYEMKKGGWAVRSTV